MPLAVVRVVAMSGELGELAGGPRGVAGTAVYVPSVSLPVERGLEPRATTPLR